MLKQINQIQKMISFDNATGENTITHNPKWPYIQCHSNRILIIGSLG